MASDMSRQRQEEQEAVRTTIVGGRPPGCGKSTGSIPRGIEVLIKKAAVDPEFKSLLLSRRGEAARSIGLELSASESMMLSAVPVAQLQSIIAATTVPPSHVPAFLGKVAAVMLAALGVVQGGCDRDHASRGIRPESEPAPKDKVSATTRPAPPADDQPLIIAGAVTVKPMTHPVTQPTEPISPVAGIRPASSPGIAGERIDRPPGPATEPTTQPASTQPPQNITVYGLMIDRPQNTVIRGIRIDTPRVAPATQPTSQPVTEPAIHLPKAVFGGIPDRPGIIKGIRTDRPDAPSTAPTTKPTTEPEAQSEPPAEPDFPVAIDGIRPDRPRRNQ